MNEKKKTLTNLTVGVVTQLIVIALGLIVPRIVLVNYGSDTNGLINTIGQILQKSIVCVFVDGYFAFVFTSFHIENFCSLLDYLYLYSL